MRVPTDFCTLHPFEGFLGYEKQAIDHEIHGAHESAKFIAEDLRRRSFIAVCAGQDLGRFAFDVDTVQPAS